MGKEISKYSLWITPDGQSAQPINKLVARVEAELLAASFLPHLTIAAYLPASKAEFSDLKETAGTLAKSLEAFTITTGNFGFKDEEFRSLYLKVSSPELDSVYEAATVSFPQVANEPFRALPHISVLYGSHP